MDPKNRELLIRAAGMLEGASWFVDKQETAEFCIDVSEMIYEALGMKPDEHKITKEDLYDS